MIHHQPARPQHQAQPATLGPLYSQFAQLQTSMNTVASPMLVTAQQLQQLQQQNQHIQIQHYQPVPIQAVAGTPMVRPMVLKQHSLPAFSAQSLPQATAQGHVMAASTFHNVSVTPVVAASRVSLSIDNPRQLVRPPGSVIMAPAAALASPRRVQVPMAGIAGPIFIAAGPPSIIRDPQRTKALLERPVPRINVQQRTNTLLSDFWGPDMDVSKDGRIVKISERARNSIDWRRRTPKKTGIVVGIDFGNTFTGVSYSHMNDGEMIDVVKWPKHLNAYAKVPTVSLYKTTDEKSFVDWGSAAITSYKRSKNDRVLVRDYKLHLFDQGARGRLEHSLYLTDVFTQYIRSIHRYVIDEVNKSHGFSAESIPMHYCITVPEAWTLPTRELVLRCYVEAGVIPQTPAPNMTVITEAEAAATYCREHCTEFETLRDGNVFMICDGGGLTTHVTAFRVDDSLGVRQFVRLSSSHAEDCGSDVLDQKFKELMLRRLEGLDIDAKPQRQKALETLVEGFIEIKYQFDSSSRDETKHLPIPLGLDVSELVPTPSWLEDEYMSLSGQELCDAVFEPVVGRIEELVREQSKKHPDCACMFLVGGFGSNKYLHRRLMTLSEKKSPSDGVIQKVVMVQKAELAVARGAVIYGLKSAAQQSRPFL